MQNSVWESFTFWGRDAEGINEAEKSGEMTKTFFDVR